MSHSKLIWTLEESQRHLISPIESCRFNSFLLRIRKGRFRMSFEPFFECTSDFIHCPKDRYILKF